MDFFQQQDKARRNTRRLVVYFVVAIVLIVLSVHVAVSLLFFVGTEGRHRHGGPVLLEETAEGGARGRRPMLLTRPDVFGWVTLGTLAVILGGTLWRIAELSGGGSTVATMLGGQLVNPATTDLDERKLLNVVEEMAIAAGVPVPKTFLLRDEEGINAFAAGTTPGDAVVGVTRGCIRLLTRDELQGVLAHEFSHILNGDMWLNIRLIGWIFGIMGLALVGRILLYSRSGNSRDKNPLPLLGLVLIALGGVGVFFGRLIQSAVSRQREFLADASAVQFTRNPEGLASALKKIGGLGQGSKLEASRAAEVGHLFFANGLADSFLAQFATHPPLAERIRALDPSFDGRFPEVHLAAARADAGSRRAAPRAPAVLLPLPGMGGAFANGRPPTLPVSGLLSQLGSPTPAHLEYAAGWRQSLPAAVATAAGEPMGASVLIYGLLLDSDDAIREGQIEALRRIAGEGIAQETVRLWPAVALAAARARLPLVDLALPSLGQLSENQYRQFRAAMQALIEADQRIDLFEYVLQQIVRRHVGPRFGEGRRRVTQYYALAPLLPDCALLLGLLAQVGQDTPGEIAVALQAGWQQLGVGGPAPEVGVEAAGDLEQLDVALGRLDQAAPLLKQKILQACAQTVAVDGVVTDVEAELLRAVADTLDCPIPPYIRTATG